MQSLISLIRAVVDVRIVVEEGGLLSTAGEFLRPCSWVQADAVQFSHLGYCGCCNAGRDRPAMELAGVRLGDGGGGDAGGGQFSFLAAGGRGRRQGGRTLTLFCPPGAAV